VRQAHFHPIAFNHYNSYRHWESHVVWHSPVAAYGRPGAAPVRASYRPNNVMVGHDGAVYRRTETGAIERHEAGQWKAVEPARPQASEINRQFEARGMGEVRSRAPEPVRAPMPMRTSPGSHEFERRH
jgi:hypothetical protein